MIIKVSTGLPVATRHCRDMIVEKDVKPKQHTRTHTRTRTHTHTHTHTTTTSWMPSFVELLLVRHRQCMDQMDHGTFNMLAELKVPIVMAKWCAASDSSAMLSTPSIESKVADCGW